MARLQEWQKARDEFREDTAFWQAYDGLCARHSAGDSAAIKDICDIILCNSKYPAYFPSDWSLDFDLQTGTLLVEFRLPSLADMPTFKEVKYDLSSDVFVEVRLFESFINALYDSVVYQVCLRTLHELFSNDKIQALKAIVFNGWVKYTDPATGHETQAYIVTVQAFADQINLAAVDPKACFRSLKGVGSTQVQAMVPLQPLLQLYRTDRRFMPMWMSPPAVN